MTTERAKTQITPQRDRQFKRLAKKIAHEVSEEPCEAESCIYEVVLDELRRAEAGRKR